YYAINMSKYYKDIRIGLSLLTENPLYTIIKFHPIAVFTQYVVVIFVLPYTIVVFVENFIFLTYITNIINRGYSGDFRYSKA
ncbi:MAG: hypothetical protein K2M82_00165, partial [Lachnospiraceae bacterium]|nr:hypothetical protein [Lachnospiraceae bacterium]